MANTASTSSMVSSRRLRRWLERWTGYMPGTLSLASRGERWPTGRIYRDLLPQVAGNNGIAGPGGHECLPYPLGGDDDAIVSVRGRKVQDGADSVCGTLHLSAVEEDESLVALGAGQVPERPVRVVDVAETA